MNKYAESLPDDLKNTLDQQFKREMKVTKDSKELIYTLIALENMSFKEFIKTYKKYRKDNQELNMIDSCILELSMHFTKGEYVVGDIINKVDNR